ncbi:hypothetical protein B0H13DRAFT_2154113 [Mycena leptocephala]|nr:hypothetical protein B0H13DRAFT_2154113 [Mycena leptocephala]
MSEGFKTVYGLDQSETWSIQSQIKYLNGEHFAALDDLRTRFGDALKSADSGVHSGTWKDVRSPLKRSQSATRLETVDWRTDWMREDHQSNRKPRKRRRLAILRKRRPELFTPGSQLEKEANEGGIEVPFGKRDVVQRLHRSKTKSVGGGLSLVFSRMVL